MSNKPFQSHIGYLSHRSISSKVSTNSPVSMAQNLQASFEKPDKDQNKLKKPQNEQGNNFQTQNSILKQENRVLRKQLNYFRAEGILQNYHSKQSKSEVNDLRQTIKKQNGEISQLKTRLQMISKQCKMYEDIIEKMQSKITRLIEQNKSLSEQVKQSSSTGQTDKSKKAAQIQHKISWQSDKQKMQMLTDKVNELIKSYHELQLHVESEQSEWQRWKKQWNKQKIYYLHRIQDLEKMMGIGNSNLDYSKEKKRF